MTVNVYERIGSRFKRWLYTSLGVLPQLGYPLVLNSGEGQVCAGAEGDQGVALVLIIVFEGVLSFL